MNSKREATRSLRRSARSARGEKRSRIMVTLSSHERVMLEQKALATGVSMSRLLVEGALRSVEVNEVNIAELSTLGKTLSDAKRQLIGIATNINQIAHHTNATQNVTDEIIPVAQNAQDLIDSITDLLETVRA